MDTNERIRQLMDERGWTEYRLAKMAGLSQSTVINIFRRNTVPGIITLESICRAFNITLSQFFQQEPSSEEEQFLSLWRRLDEKQKKAVLQIMETMD